MTGSVSLIARLAQLMMLAVVALAAAATGAAQAAVIGSSVAGFEGGPAIAGDGRIIVGERRGDGALRIRAIDPRTGAATTLASFGRLADPHAYTHLVVSGTGAIVTATLHTWREATGPQSGPEHDIPTLLSSRAMTILPAVRPIASCSGRSLGLYSQLDTAGGEDFVATIGSECAQTSTAVRLQTPTGSLAIGVGPSYANPGVGAPNILALRATGAMVAWIEQGQPAPGQQLSRTVVVARGATGEVLLRSSNAGYSLGPFGLGSDGTVVLSTLFPACALAVVSPAAPTPRVLRLPSNLCAYSQSSRSLALAGGRVVYGGIAGFGVSNLRDSSHPLVEANSSTGVSSPVAFDGRTAFVVRSDCDSDRLLAVDAGEEGEAPREDRREPCLIRRSGSSRLRVTPAGRVALRLRCDAGCRGTLRLVQQRRGHRERLVGSAEYAGAGAVVVRPRLARYARSLAGCSGGLRVTAVVFRRGGRSSPYERPTKGLGAYRLASRSPCRRTGGPVFASPLPAPRP